jgi:hypothetical protein
MDIETLIAEDQAALVSRLEADDFADRALAKLRSARRLRLAFVGAAGAGGTALASSQFDALVSAISDAAPMLNSVSVNGAAVATGLSPTLLAALCFAVVGGATAIIAPGSR